MRKDVLCLMVKNVFFTLCNSAFLSKLKPSWLSETVFVHILYKFENWDSFYLYNNVKANMVHKEEISKGSIFKGQITMDNKHVE